MTSLLTVYDGKQVDWVVVRDKDSRASSLDAKLKEDELPVEPVIGIEVGSILFSGRLQLSFASI